MTPTGPSVIKGEPREEVPNALQQLSYATHLLITPVLCQQGLLVGTDDVGQGHRHCHPVAAQWRRRTDLGDTVVPYKSKFSSRG